MPLLDRDVLDVGLSRRTVEALEVPVDQRAQRQQELADQVGQLVLELARRDPAHPVEQHEQRGGIEGAARRRGRAVGILVVAKRLGGHRGFFWNEISSAPSSKRAPLVEYAARAGGRMIVRF